MIYGDVFTPYIKEIIITQKDDIQKKIFEFIERLLIVDDDYTNEVISFSVLESLIFDEEINNQDFLKYAGRKTLDIVNEIIDEL